jgi:hypothetical protein
VSALAGPRRTPARIAGDSCARTTAAFRQQNLQVIPLAVTPALTPAQRNRLALRETAATLLYRLQGRF